MNNLLIGHVPQSYSRTDITTAMQTGHPLHALGWDVFEEIWWNEHDGCELLVYLWMSKRHLLPSAGQSINLHRTTVQLRIWSTFNETNKQLCFRLQHPCIQHRCVIQIDNLKPDETYVFAVAAYDTQGRPLGSHQNGIGRSTMPILVCSEWDELMPFTYLVEVSFPVYLVISTCWYFLSISRWTIPQSYKI